LITLELASGDQEVSALKQTLLDEGAVQHVFTTAEAAFVVYARVPDTNVANSWLADTLDAGAIDDFGVTLLAAADWSPDLGGTEFALTCAQCGNTVDSEGTAARIGDELY